MNITLPYKWSPRPYQVPLWKYLAAGGKRAVTNGHRRSGKDEVFLNFTACSAFSRVGNYWYMLPEYGQARKSMWDAINPKTGKRRIDDIFPVEIRETTREAEMMIKFKNRSTFQLVGSDNFNSLVGSPPVGLVFSEYALSDPSAWGYLMPIVEENGGWVGFNSTPRGKNHFKAMCELAKTEEGWFFSLITADHTDVFTKKQLASILKQMQATYGDQYGKSLWLQEYFCSFDAAQPGSIWGEHLDIVKAEGRICKVPHIEGHEVFTAWDLGFDDDTAIWFYQIIDGDIRMIDYYENRFKDVRFYASVLRERHLSLGYDYGMQWLPHDARPRTVAAGGESILQQFLNENRDRQLGSFAICPRLDVEEGIQAARATFPKCWFDEEKCEPGLEHLIGYKRTWDDEKKIFSSSPLHNGDSHASDAFRYLSLTWKENKPVRSEMSLADRLSSGNPTAQTFGVIKDAHLSKMRSKREMELW